MNDEDLNSAYKKICKSRWCNFTIKEQEAVLEVITTYGEMK